MANPAPVAQAEPAAPAVTAPAVEPSFAELDAALYGGAPSEAPGSPVEPVKGTEPPVPEAAPVEGVQPPVETAPAAAEPAVESSPTLPDRIRTGQFDDSDKRVLAVFHEMNAGRKPGESGYVSIGKVATLLAESEPAATPPATEPAPIDLITTKLETAKTELQTLLEKKQEAVEFGSDTADIEAQIVAQQELVEDAKIDAKLAQREAAQQQAQQAAASEQAQRNAQVAAEKAAVQQFPTIADKASPLGARARTMAAAMKDPSHPDNAVMFTPNAAMFIAERAAVEEAKEISKAKNIPFAQAYGSLMAEAAPIVPAPGAPEPRRILPASGHEGSAPPPPAPTEAQIVQNAGWDDQKLTEAIYGKEAGAWMIGT